MFTGCMADRDHTSVYVVRGTSIHMITSLLISLDMNGTMDLSVNGVNGPGEATH